MNDQKKDFDELVKLTGSVKAAKAVLCNALAVEEEVEDEADFGRAL